MNVGGQRPQNIKAVAFDLDGTLYADGIALGGAREVVAAARETGLEIAYITNTSGRTRAEVSALLSKMGIPCGRDDVYTSAAATGIWLSRHGMRDVLVLGSHALLREIDEAGVTAVLLDLDVQGQCDCVAADALVVGLDGRLVSQARLRLPDMALRAAREGRMRLVACNRDMSFPGRDGRLHPGCGVLVEMVETACERSMDIVVGKPGTLMLELLGMRLKLRMEEILVVGDSPESDVRMAEAAGAPWVLVDPTSASLKSRIGDAPPSGVVMPDLASLAAWLSRQ